MCPEWTLRVQLTGATRPGPPQPPAFNSLALATHFSGRTYLSLIFFRNSGYIVSAPPLTASSGIPQSLVTSSTNGFCPGRKRGTFPVGIPSNADVHGTAARLVGVELNCHSLDT